MVKTLSSFGRVVLSVVLAAALPLAMGGCRASTQASAGAGQPPPYPQQPYPQQQQPYPQQPYPQQPYPQQPYPQQPQPAPQPNAATRPLLAPLQGYPAQQQEVAAILAELQNNLSPDKQALVRGIPLVFDPTLEVNAFAGCDDRGAPFLAGTRGILDAVDAIAQTRATDELFGTKTYDAYTSTVIPQLLQSDQASAALPAGIIPANLGPDPRRWSRAHELFDEIVAFTFGHELAHHYLGHTGCAHGQPASAAPALAQGFQVAARAVPFLNQFNENDADKYGCWNVLDTARARRPQYAWSENGGILLLDFFSRLERSAGFDPLGNLLKGDLRAAGKNAVASFMMTHTGSAARLPLVQVDAQIWRSQHPG